MKTFEFKIDGKDYEVSVNEKGGSSYEIVLNGVTHTIEYNEGANQSVKRSMPSITKLANAATPNVNQPPVVNKPDATGSFVVIAPIPGNILRIAVAVGDHVKRGDTLLTLESMKMENDILSEKDAIVKAIHVHVGDTIMQDRALIDLE
jgi:biotin carboxyl carrier protein